VSYADPTRNYAFPTDLSKSFDALRQAFLPASAPAFDACAFDLPCDKARFLADVFAFPYALEQTWFLLSTFNSSAEAYM